MELKVFLNWGGNSCKNLGVLYSIKLISSFILSSVAVVVRTLSKVTELTASESIEDTTDIKTLFQ